MPSSGAEQRGRQLALLGRLIHERTADRALGALLADEKPDTPAERATVDALARQHRRAARVPATLIEEQKRTQARAVHAWVEARQQKSWLVFQPWLQRIVELKRDEGRCLADTSDLYAPFLDDNEPGLTVEQVDRLFDELAPRLAALVARFEKNPKRGDRALLQREFPVPAQRALVEEIAGAVGFDLSRGRIDVTAHPFCTGIGPGDVRIALRFSPVDLRDGLSAALHEAGHAMYEQNLPEELAGLPSYPPRSLSVHESQSRLWENLVGRSRAFAGWLLPRVQRAFPGVVDDASPEALWRAVNVVVRDTNRVRADEATYNLHILVRHRIERALLLGALDVEALPSAWNDEYEAVVGVRPKDDVEGVLQDGHWSAGLFGYFPTYTLGNLIAAQLFEAVRASMPSVDDDIAAGRFEPLLSWLRSKVHLRGGTALLPEIVEDATGAPLTSAAFLRHLEAKAAALEA